MRIFLKEPKKVGEAIYQGGRFYNAPPELAKEWINAGEALPATKANEVMNPFAPSDKSIESYAAPAEGEGEQKDHPEAR